MGPTQTLRTGQLFFQMVSTLGAGRQRAHIGIHRHHLRFGLRAPFLLGHVLVYHLVNRDTLSGLPDGRIALLVIIVEDVERARHEGSGADRAQ